MGKQSITDFSGFTNHTYKKAYLSDEISHIKSQRERPLYSDDFLIAVGKAKAMANLILELEKNFINRDYNKKYHYHFGVFDVIVEATRLDEFD